VTPHLAHEDAIRLCREADVLLLAMGDTHLTPQGWLPSKLFEYLACGRPVLANTVEGEAAALLRAAGADLAIAGPDPEAFASALERYWCRKQDLGTVPHENQAEVIERLMQQHLTRRLGDLLDRVLEVSS
jgi:glycosyltransferase involved in cell wall biosynthesis